MEIEKCIICGEYHSNVKLKEMDTMFVCPTNGAEVKICCECNKQISSINIQEGKNGYFCDSCFESDQLKLYYKVYQDRETIESFFVSEASEIETIIDGWKENNEYQEELPPIFEPVFMTEKEFKNLPEFTGY